MPLRLGAVRDADQRRDRLLRQHETAVRQAHADAARHVQHVKQLPLLRQGHVPVAGAEAVGQIPGAQLIREIGAEIVADVFDGGAAAGVQDHGLAHVLELGAADQALDLGPERRRHEDDRAALAQQRAHRLARGGVAGPLEPPVRQQREEPPHRARPRRLQKRPLAALERRGELLRQADARPAQIVQDLIALDPRQSGLHGRSPLSFHTC